MFPLRDENPNHQTPVITLILIAINIACFGYELSLGQMAESWISRWAVIPAQWGDPFSSTSLVPSDHVDAILRLFTSLFLHGGIGHLVGNIWFLWIFGDNIESEYGSIRFLIFYLVCGAIAGLVHVALNLGSSLPTIGASGAVSGVLGAYLLLYPRIRIRTLIFLGFFITVARVPAMFFLGIWFFLQAVGQFGGASTEVAFGAHIGGFIAGMMLALLFPRREPQGLVQL